MASVGEGAGFGPDGLANALYKLIVKCCRDGDGKGE